MVWFFVAITLGACSMATFVGSIRRAVLALWVAGLGIGGIYLTIGAELLAVVQWILSTLVAISFVFFAVMFGEYNATESRTVRQRLLQGALSLALGGAFAAVIYLGVSGLPEASLVNVGPAEGADLMSIGKSLIQENLLSLEILALTLFLVLVGAGVISRPEAIDR
jgi:NADH:ubiquinone oxidoreductase subunit 6 (subunit J)